MWLVFVRYIYRFRVMLVIGLFAAAACAARRDEPNIFLIIGDDHGWPYFGFMGSRIVRTPNLDALAAEGMLFRNGFTTASTCRPSLMSLLTGLHPIQWEARVEALEQQQTPGERGSWIREFVTLPRLLAKRGYASFQGGKYWEGTFLDGGFTEGTKAPIDSVPTNGIEVMKRWSGGDGLELGRSTMQPLWDFLEAHRDGPFFVWFAPKLPHTPHDASDRYKAPYVGLGLSEAAVEYYANITRFDERVGEVVAYLERTGLREQTLVVYLSDNGWQQPPHGTPRVTPLGGSKGKSSLYELGFRTPLLFSWPGRIPAGRMLDELVSTVDVFATLADFAGLEPPANRTGRSLRPLLTGEGGFDRTRVIGGAPELRPPPASAVARGATLTRPERAYFLRTDTWRYVWYPESERYRDRKAEELYRIHEDPLEKSDVAAEHPELTTQFRDAIQSWVEQMQRSSE